MEDTAKKLEEAQKQLEKLKENATTEMSSYKQKATAAASWMDPKELESPKSLLKILSVIESLNGAYDSLKEVLEEIDDLINERTGTITMLERDLKTAMTLGADVCIPRISIAQALKRVSTVVNGKYIKEEGHGTPGQPDYKPTLWYWITPEGKKLKVDQKSDGV